MFRLFRKYDVCAVGAGSRDVFVKSKHFERMPDKTAPDGFDACFAMGAKIPLDEVIFETGGGATNAAVTFGRFGLDTTCVCALGDDPNGQDILKVFKNEKIDDRGVQIIEDAKTAYSVILLAGTGQRSILVYRGATSELDPNQIAYRNLKARWLYLTSLGGNLKKNRTVVSQMRRYGSKIAWNPGNGELANGLKALAPLLKMTDILIMNREEAAALAKESKDNLPAVLKKLTNLPKVAMVVTDGKNGAYVFDKKSKRLLYSPALPGKRINTTGAGDSFGSGFVAAYLKTGSCEEGLKVGLLNSLGVITHMGAKAGILKQYPDQKALKRIKIKNL
ncbi:MAG: carbohydrate kinase family protein [Patescibacteria group bacterium]|nr:carbohydrate kinase family protein [Patescibacteria group bacterium]